MNGSLVILVLSGIDRGAAMGISVDCSRIRNNYKLHFVDVFARTFSPSLWHVPCFSVVIHIDTSHFDEYI